MLQTFNNSSSGATSTSKSWYSCRGGVEYTDCFPMDPFSTSYDMKATSTVPPNVANLKRAVEPNCQLLQRPISQRLSTTRLKHEIHLIPHNKIILPCIVYPPCAFLLSGLQQMNHKIIQNGISLL